MYKFFFLYRFINDILFVYNSRIILRKLSYFNEIGMNNHLSYKMEGDKSTNNYNDDYYKNVKLVGFVKTDSETLSGYKNDAFQWSSSDNLSSCPPVYHIENDIVPSEYLLFNIYSE